MAQWVKLLPAMSTSHVRKLVQILNIPLPIQLRTNAPETAAEYGRSPGIPDTYAGD